jgi:hypothetical protein
MGRTIHSTGVVPDVMRRLVNPRDSGPIYSITLREGVDSSAFDVNSWSILERGS